MNKETIKGYIYVVLSAIIFGCMPLMAKVIYKDGVTPLSLVLFRNAFSIPVLAILAIRQTGSLKVPPCAIPSMSVMAVMGGSLTPVLLFLSYTYIDSGTATVFHFIYPVAVVVGQVIFFKCKFKMGEVISLLLCIAGICMFYTPGANVGILGGGIALLSGITYACYVLLISSFRHKQVSGFLFAFYLAIICTFVMTLVCLISRQLVFPHTAMGWIMTVLFAIMINAGAGVLFQMGTFKIGGDKASILSTFEPITSVIVGAIAFNEVISLNTAIGVLLVISASILIIASGYYATKNKEEQ